MAEPEGEPPVIEISMGRGGAEALLDVIEDAAEGNPEDLQFMDEDLWDVYVQLKQAFEKAGYVRAADQPDR